MSQQAVEYGNYNYLCIRLTTDTQKILFLIPINVIDNGELQLFIYIDLLSYIFLYVHGLALNAKWVINHTYKWI